MPYRSYDELIDDASKDPKLARMRVNKAKQGNNPVVDSDNPGYEDYRSRAINKRMRPKSQPPTGNRKTNAADMAGAKKAVSQELNKAIESRMKNNQPPNRQARGSSEEQIVTKRKKFGY